MTFTKISDHPWNYVDHYSHLLTARRRVKPEIMYHHPNRSSLFTPFPQPHKTISASDIVTLHSYDEEDTSSESGLVMSSQPSTSGLTPSLMPAPLSQIPGVAGKQYVRGTKEHKDARYQYATSTHYEDHEMDPALIIGPKSKHDIKLVIKHAKEKKISVAVRTGGHQYSGASSTGCNHIQLDLSRTFQGKDDQKVVKIDDGLTLIRTSISWPLGDFNAWLTARGLFVPHGQCTEVHLGGHCQTGGYGQLARSFGLFGDHVRMIEMIDHNGVELEVTRESDPDLFWAVLGGSPGNFGIITHITVQVYRDSDYTGSRGLKAVYLYNPKILKRLIDIQIRMSDDLTFPANYDLCISVLSSSFPIVDLWPELDGQMRLARPDIYGGDKMLGWPRTIVVYAQWVPLKEGDQCDKTWFKQFDKDKLYGWVEQKAMSKITGDWIFRNVREFENPYVKRAYTTKSTNLANRRWSDWVTKRIDAIVRPNGNRCRLAVQLQCYGGNESRFHINANNGTSYSWRDTTMVAVLDCFHEDDAKERAEDWAKVNDAEGLGPNGKFSVADRRVL